MPLLFTFKQMLMKNFMNSIKLQRPGRNTFDLSHTHKTTTDFGRLTPTLVMECLPGETHYLDCENVVRFAPMVAPTMHRFDVYTHYWFVPNRILWPNWEKYITGHASNPVHPYLEVGPNDNGQPSWNKLYGYLGIPKPLLTGGTTNELINPMAFAAYQACYHEAYRDQNLVPEFDYKLQDGNNSTAPNIAALTTLRIRANEHDYFTSCLPFAQKGAQVDIPLGDVVLKDPPFSTVGSVGNIPNMRKADGTVIASGDIVAATHGAITGIDIGTDQQTVYDPDGTLQTEATSINELRRAFALQRFLERSARAGSRYIETILGHFGVRSSDKRLQRPEYITGTSSPVNVSEVLNTTGTATAPQGAMAGHGISVTSRKYGKKYFCEEHGYIIGIQSIMPRTGYFQGIPKHFSRVNSRFDYFFPEFGHLGEQAVKVREIYAYSASGDTTFGYLPMASEYRYLQSRVSGDFVDQLDFWHLDRKFATQPSLNQAFIECNPGKRIFAVNDPNVDSLWCTVLHKIRSTRPVPKYGTPGNY